MPGIKLKPVKQRKSLYLLIPMEIAELIGVTKDTVFTLTLRQDGRNLLIYEQTRTPPRGEDINTSTNLLVK